MTGRRIDRGTWHAAALVVATCLGLAHAGISVVWLLGDQVLLDTVGGSLASWAARGGSTVTAALLAVIALKLVAVAVGVTAERGGSGVRALGWLTAAVLIGYSGVEMSVAMLMVAGGLHRPSGVAQRAAMFHAWLWDPWFLLWGLALLVVLARTRRDAPGRLRA